MHGLGEPGLLSPARHTQLGHPQVLLGGRQVQGMGWGRWRQEGRAHLLPAGMGLLFLREGLCHWLARVELLAQVHLRVSGQALQPPDPSRSHPKGLCGKWRCSRVIR